MDIDYEGDWAGEQRTDPSDGNSFVLRAVNAEGGIDLSGIYVEVNDIMGGHHLHVPLAEWLAWEKL
jgi:hypothetical protein